MAINNISTGAVSIRFKHPDKNLDFLTKLLGLPCHRSWLAGSCRQTPTGASLKGVYKESYWVSRLEFSGKDSFKNQFLSALNHIGKAKNEISKIINTKGIVEIYLQLPGDINNGGVIKNRYLKEMAELGVDLLIEVFP